MNLVGSRWRRIWQTPGMEKTVSEKAQTHHRRDERQEVQWDAEILHEDDSYSAKIGNVSLAGLLAKTDAPLSMRDELILRIPNVGEFAGIVMWMDAPFFGLALMVGPELDLKRMAVNSGAAVSDAPIAKSDDDWI